MFDPETKTQAHDSIPFSLKPPLDNPYSVHFSPSFLKPPGSDVGLAAVSGLAQAATKSVTEAHPGKAKAPRLSGNALQMSHMQPYLGAMEHTAEALGPRFEKLGIHLTPEIMMAIAMQESGNKSDPKSCKSFDNGLGIMQITPDKQGQLDGDVAKTLGWDNQAAKSIKWKSKDPQDRQAKGDYLNQHGSWQDPQTNIDAGGLVLAKKAEALKHLLPGKMWEQMTEEQRLRATMFAYNAGQGTAAKQLKKGGPDATLTSRFKGPDGQWHEHDYTQEVKGRLDYVNGHSPFKSSAAHPQDGAAPSGMAKPDLSAGVGAAAGIGMASPSPENPAGMWRD